MINIFKPCTDEWSSSSWYFCLLLLGSPWGTRGQRPLHGGDVWHSRRHRDGNTWQRDGWGEGGVPASGGGLTERKSGRGVHGPGDPATWDFRERFVLFIFFLFSLVSILLSPHWSPLSFSPAGSDGAASSYHVKQLEEQNSRLKEALVRSVNCLKTRLVLAAAFNPTLF